MLFQAYAAFQLGFLILALLHQFEPKSTVSLLQPSSRLHAGSVWEELILLGWSDLKVFWCCKPEPRMFLVLQFLIE